MRFTFRRKREEPAAAAVAPAEAKPVEVKPDVFCDDCYYFDKEGSNCKHKATYPNKNWQNKGEPVFTILPSEKNADNHCKDYCSHAQMALLQAQYSRMQQPRYGGLLGSPYPPGNYFGRAGQQYGSWY